MLDAAKRAVADSVGEDLKLWCPSNTPMAVNYRVYNSKSLSSDFCENYYGEKIFYFRVQWDSGDVSESALEKNGEKEYGWLTRKEIVEKVEGERGVHQAKFFHYML